jgi:hypothetical protein
MLMNEFDVEILRESGTYLAAASFCSTLDPQFCGGHLSTLIERLRKPSWPHAG